MEDILKIFQTIAFVCAAVTAVLAVISYMRQQNLTRLQNLISVFQRFANNEDFISIFSLCDHCYVRLNDAKASEELDLLLEKLSEISTEKKFKYLALLEEIAIYSKNSAVIRKHALHLFKFHFYYVYGVGKISSAFWKNVGDGDNNEKNKEGWSYQNEFASECASIITKS